jgi:hypothetical protein
MTRNLVFALPALLLTVSFASAQSYTYPLAKPGDPATIVNSWTRGYLRREAAPASPWIQSLERGRSPLEVQANMLASDEYFRKAGGTEPAYVRQLYMDLLGREPLPPEITYWMGRLHYQPRRDVVAQLLRFHPQNVSGMRPVPPSYDPGYFPDPVSPTFRDPSGPYFHSPYLYNYENSRSIRAFPISAQG